ncbi:MAG: SpoIIE family protein phosphatase [Opitutales bacterium]|nr:SpoIIE family protein phosphatase [Opitutales bacterium]
MLPAFISGFFAAALLFGAALYRASKSLRKTRDDLENLEEENAVVFGAFHKLVSDIGDGADIGAIYSRILRTLMFGCGASCASFYEKNAEGRLYSAYSEGVFPPQRELSPFALKSASSRAELISRVFKGEEIEFGEGVIGEAAEERTPIFIKNAAASARVVNHKDPLLKITSMIAVPVCFRDEFFGVLAVANPMGGGSFSESDFSIARSIADQASLLLYSMNAFAQLVEKSKIDLDLSVASSVQSCILPEKMERVEGYEFAARYIPRQKVGGDFYDTFNLDGGKIGVVIGDVSGKGVAAALIMAICQTALRFLAREFSSPSEVLKALNSRMFAATRADMFITLIYAVIDTRAGKITFARAGHEKPVLASAAGAKFLASKGAAVGMASSKIFDATISEVVEPFNPGDTLVLYTDGVTEAVDLNGEEFSSERLGALIAENAGLSAEELNEKITGAVLAFTKGVRAQSDDYTLLAVRRNS